MIRNNISYYYLHVFCILRHDTVPLYARLCANRVSIKNMCLKKHKLVRRKTCIVLMRFIIKYENIVFPSREIANDFDCVPNNCNTNINIQTKFNF